MAAWCCEKNRRAARGGCVRLARRPRPGGPLNRNRVQRGNAWGCYSATLIPFACRDAPFESQHLPQLCHALPSLTIGRRLNVLWGDPAVASSVRLPSSRSQATGSAASQSAPQRTALERPFHMLSNAQYAPGRGHQGGVTSRARGGLSVRREPGGDSHGRA